MLALNAHSGIITSFEEAKLNIQNEAIDFLFSGSKDSLLKAWRVIGTQLQQIE